MSFNELNTVEHYIVYQLTGVNDKGKAQEPAVPYGSPTATSGNGAQPRWRYVPGSQFRRKETEVLVEADLKEALIRLNLSIKTQPTRMIT